jgi:hypothetical protein
MKTVIIINMHVVKVVEVLLCRLVGDNAGYNDGEQSGQAQ